MAPSSHRWQLNPIGCLHWRSWDREQYILFNVASSQTHVLNELGAAVVRLLEKNPLNTEELSDQLGAYYDGLVVDTELATAIDSLLETLDTLGLIEPVE